MPDMRVTSVLGDGERFRTVQRAVERLAFEVPGVYLAGLDQILLREARTFTRREKRKKASGRRGKVPLDGCLGVYRRKFRGRPAHIELFVDNIIADWPALLLSVPPIVDAIVGKVLFHELGHHIHATSDRRLGDREAIADEWRERLSRQYFRRKYHYLRPFGGLLRLLGRALKGLAKLRRRRHGDP